MKILVDNGHGVETAGKRSPDVIGTGIYGDAVIDGHFREGVFARLVARSVVKSLKQCGYNTELLVPEDADISLNERVRRANDWCQRFGSKNVVVVSIHTNASGNGDLWMNGRGWEVYTSRGETRSDKLASLLGAHAAQLLPGMAVRADYSDGDVDKEASFYILTKTNCAAVLTENLFHDNLDDVRFLTSKEGVDKIAEIHVRALVAYAEKYACC